MTVDLRTRADGDHDPIDPDTFFTTTLPDALAAHAGEVGPGVGFLAPRPLTVEVGEAAWTLRARGERVDVCSGAGDDGAVVRLTAEQLDDLVHDQQTFMGFWTAGALEQPRGHVGHLLDWWLVLRGALDGQPIYTPGSITFRDRDGARLDLRRSFRLEDDPEEMGHFLTEAGYLHVEGAFGEGEMAAVASDMDRAAPSYAPGDGRSWWATTADGARRLVRMQGFDERSPAAAALVGDARFLALGDIPGDRHEWGARRSDNRIEALFKPIGVVAGISDIPWHKDCSLGRHSYECCSLTVGVSVTGADAESGQLWVLAGSHRALVWAGMKQPRIDLPEVPLPTRTGDVTVHLSCTQHMAQAPTVRERRVLYSGFALPPSNPAAAGEARARLRAVREAAPRTVADKRMHA